jgi:hypothetical protein
MQLIILALVLLSLITPKTLHANILINEIFPNPEGSDVDNAEWVEFYNSGNQTVDLSHFYLDDDTNFDEDIGSGIIQLTGKLNAGDLCFWGLSSYLNNSGDTPTLFDSDKKIIDSYSFSSSSEGKSISRIPNGGVWVLDQKPSKANTNCLSLASIPPSSTVSPTILPVAYAFYKINDVYDSDANLLSSVKIYVDGNYLHHYAPETIKFCDGCDCDGYAGCSLGPHDIKLEKYGYEDWYESEVLIAGSSLEVSPVMKLLPEVSDEPKPTNAPILTLPPPIDITEVYKASAGAQKAEVRGVYDFTENSQALLNTDPSAIAVNEELNGNRTIAPLVIITGGVCFLAAAAYPFISKNRLKFKGLKNIFDK